MVTWFAHDADLVTSCCACTSHTREYGARAINKMGMSKYSNGLTGMPADSNLGKITASHFKALITQNANENMPVENSSSRFFQISCSQGILNSSRLPCYLLLRLLVYMYLSQLMRTFTNYLKCIVILS